MAFYTPQEIAEITAATGVKKANLPLANLLILGFLAGAFVALGFLLDIRVIGTAPKSWGSVASFLGAAVFPVGLIFVLLAGAELVTGNMMSVALAKFTRRITWGQLFRNWFWVTIANFIGSVFVAYCFGHVVGLTEGEFLAKTVAIAESKTHHDFLTSFISAIGCNWMVCLAVWLAYGAQDFAGKIFGIWFPIMGFVAIGFQHVVANMFVIPAAIFAGHGSWSEYLSNFVAVYLGNTVGGAVFVGFAYYFTYLRATGNKEATKETGHSQKSNEVRGWKRTAH